MKRVLLFTLFAMSFVGVVTAEDTAVDKAKAELKTKSDKKSEFLKDSTNKKIVDAFEDHNKEESEAQAKVDEEIAKANAPSWYNPMWVVNSVDSAVVGHPYLAAATVAAVTLAAWEGYKYWANQSEEDEEEDEL